jgi:N-acetylmuramoyl-L-alanine amidase
MKLKNKTAAVFAVMIIGLIGYILYASLKPPVSVIIQAGHEGRTCGNTGAECKNYREEEWNIYVANEAAKQLKKWGINVKRVPANISLQRAKIAVAIHFDGAKNICRSGASVGYPDNNASFAFAQRWKSLYSKYYPFEWHEDNFTDNLRAYYAYRFIRAEKFLVLELGELTCEKQTRWLKPRLSKIAHLIAYAIATELGKEVPKPQLTK